MLILHHLFFEIQIEVFIFSIVVNCLFSLCLPPFSFFVPATLLFLFFISSSICVYFLIIFMIRQAFLINIAFSIFEQQFVEAVWVVPLAAFSAFWIFSFVKCLIILILGSRLLQNGSQIIGAIFNCLLCFAVFFIFLMQPPWNPLGGFDFFGGVDKEKIGNLVVLLMVRHRVLECVVYD